MIAHEVAHALGFWHEQSRPDRDTYVNVKWENIDRDSKGQFLKEQPSDVDNAAIPYDYGSIMHYRSKAFARSHINFKEPEVTKPYCSRHTYSERSSTLQTEFLKWAFLELLFRVFIHRTFSSSVFRYDDLYTISTFISDYQKTIGQRDQLSFNDIRLMNSIYCSSSCPRHLPCQRGGYTDPRRCDRCRCPDGFNGQYCDQVLSLSLSQVHAAS